MMRMIAVLERLDAVDKVRAGGWCLTRFKKIGSWWVLGRLGARQLAHGSASVIVGAETVAPWIERALEAATAEGALFAAALMARRTDEDGRDVPQATRDHVVKALRRHDASRSWVALVTEGASLSDADARRVFGEALPSGLVLTSS